MYRIDNPSAAPTRPTPKAPGTPGYFTGGDAVAGTEATIVEADWLNVVQEELIAILDADSLPHSKTATNQVITAILDLIAKNTRKRLTAPLNLYVSTTGNDANDGLTPGTAFATPQQAWNYIVDALDTAGQSVRVNIADGTYGSLMCSGQYTGNGYVYFVGNLSNPLAVTFATSAQDTHALALTAGALVSIQGVDFTATGSTGCGIYAWGSQCFMENCNFGPCNGGHIVMSLGALLTISGAYTISGGAGSHFESTNGGLITCNTNHLPVQTVTISGTPTFSNAFALCAAGSINLNPALIVFSGAANGPRYLSEYNGAIMTNGGGANYFPGSSAGVADGASYGSYMP